MYMYSYFKVTINCLYNTTCAISNNIVTPSLSIKSNC